MIPRVLGLIVASALVVPALAQNLPAAPPEAATVQASALATHINDLVSFDFPVRMNAARTLRRSAPADVVPLLIDAARNHKDSYVRYRALVLLAGFGETAAGPVMRELMADPNDRLRAVAYAWFEHHPDPAVVPALVAALETETSEFVRPALTRALAAAHDVPAAQAAVRPLIARGEDFFRGTVIEALGDHGAIWAVPAITEVAELDGPLQDDAIIALGKLGQRASLVTLAALQKTAARDTQPSLAAATCLITRECEAHEDYLQKTLTFAAADAQYQALLRSSSFALAALATRGSVRAVSVLFDVAEPAVDPARAALALAVGHVALRNPAIMLEVLARRTTRDAGIGVLRDAFDMLSEDFEEERFYVAIRQAYWAAPDGSPTRTTAMALIEKLEF